MLNLMEKFRYYV